MPRNTYFSQGTKSEQSLYEDIVIEGLKIYGHDAYYIPRKIVNEDSIFNEDQLSSFGSSYMVEAYVANVDGYEGEGDLLSKFGLEIKDQVTLVIANRRWEQLVGRHVASDTTLDRAVTRRPMEGDLIYLPFAKGLFEISFVEQEDPFYQLQNLPTFQLKLELFQYGGEDIDTGVDVIDTYETQFAQKITLDMASGANGYNGLSTGLYASSNNIDGGASSPEAFGGFINPPSGAISSYQVGEEIYQHIAGKGGSGLRVISGEVASWDADTQKLEVYGSTGFENSPEVTWTAGSQHAIDAGVSTSFAWVRGRTSAASWYIKSLGSLSDNLADMEETDPSSDNSEFETIGNNFIDFSISNPFGLPNA